MIEAPPRQSKLVCWLQAAAFSTVIFLTIPFARSLQALVRENLGRSIFHYVVVGAVVGALVAGIAKLRRVRLGGAFNVVWLVLVGGVFVTYAFALDTSPEEAIHFVEYGALGLLLFRALTHHVRDYGIYVSAALLGTLVGTLDEGIQWITPNRVWDVRDIWLNAFAVTLTQVGIALGLSPVYIHGRPSPKSIQWMVRSAAAAVLLLGLSLMNTPERIQRYSRVIPGLAWLGDGEHLMMQYGFMYVDPEIGRFRSRFSPEELARIDRSKAKEAAAILDRYSTGEDYGRFLKAYTASKAPFVHEARVHLFRRNHYLRETKRHPNDPELIKNAMTIAYRENQIVEKYFGHTLRASSFPLPEKEVRAILQEADLDRPYESPVSNRLFTQISEPHVRYGIFVALLIFVLTDRWQARRRARHGVPSDP